MKEALRAAVAMLEENRVGSARMNAEVLLMFVLGCDRAYLYAHPERELSAEEIERYDETLATRARGVPSQYIVGHQEFWGLDFIVGPAVLIPRPETEHLVEAVLELCKKLPHPISPTSGETRVGQPPSLARDDIRIFQPRIRDDIPVFHPRIVDVGTGSGCVALALASELPQAEIHATEISEAALEIARANAARLALDHRVTFHLADLLQGVPGRFDIIASNPPYVGESEYDKVQLEVRKYEPRGAVFAGPEGMDVIRRLAPQARAALKPGGTLAMEIGFSQEAAVREVLRDWSDVRIVPDLQGIPRVVLARK
ncbi:MAG: peptide chain release factor N(5)-glutamine methyltransferase [Acidobacteriia bacterium]|nr:peptide chain release factor N(5)-glutamine methyltransferase [Terriglobia bacterium]